MKYFKDENWINLNSHCQLQVLKRRVIFQEPAKNAEAELCLVDNNADGKIVKLLHNRKVYIVNNHCAINSFVTDFS